MLQSASLAVEPARAAIHTRGPAVYVYDVTSFFFLFFCKVQKKTAGQVRATSALYFRNGLIV